MNIESKEQQQLYLEYYIACKLKCLLTWGRTSTVSLGSSTILLGESEAIGALAVSCWRRENFPEILRRVSITVIGLFVPMRFDALALLFRFVSKARPGQQIRDFRIFILLGQTSLFRYFFKQSIH